MGNFFKKIRQKSVRNPSNERPTSVSGCQSPQCGGRPHASATVAYRIGSVGGELGEGGLGRAEGGLGGGIGGGVAVVFQPEGVERQ